MQTAVRPHGRPGRDPSALASFRPTPRQALAHGLYVGTLATLALALMTAAAVITPALIDAVAGTTFGANRPPPIAWLGVLAPLPLALLASLGMAPTRGADCDELGINGVPLALDGFAPWKLVGDVRAERRGQRTVVAIDLDDGTVLRLRAPYDGEALAHDPQFEHKLITIRQLWEVHRNWSVPA